jgi:hypothetical protein
MADCVGWQIVDRGESAKEAAKKESLEDTKSGKAKVKKRRSHGDNLG